MKTSKSSKEITRLLSAWAEERNFAFQLQTATATVCDKERNRSPKSERALRTLVEQTVPTVCLVRDRYKASLLLFAQLYQDWDNSGWVQKYSSKLLVNLRAGKSLNIVTTSFVRILVLNASIGPSPRSENLVQI